MMEEIDRFQVPPVNGETQPLVRDERQIPPPKKQNTNLMQIYNVGKRASFSVACVVL